MGWAHCGLDSDGREIGYAIQAECDKPGCHASIDRGLSYVCGQMHGGDEHCCGRYFCSEHLVMGLGLPSQMCESCADDFHKENPEVIEAAIAEFERVRLGGGDALASS